MKLQNIAENNKLIAEFVGLSYCNKHLYEGWYKNSEHNHRICDFDGLKYHSSPEWLFPVLEKICRMKIGDGQEFVEYAYPRTFGMINEETGKIMVRLNGFPLFSADILIEATWLAVVDFIKWRNQNETV